MSHSECYPNKAPRMNRLLKTLSSPHRRELIHYFETSPQTDAESVDTIVSHLDSRIPSTNPTSAETALHHNHLPKLEQEGWIDYDSQREWVHYHGKDDAESLLRELSAIFAKN